MPRVWVEGFGNGFSVHDELLRVPEKDRMICMPHGVTTIQIVRVMKKYVVDNPDKAHRATRFIASVALARAFPCKAK
jgi:Rap1a immunity proteins